MTVLSVDGTVSQHTRVRADWLDHWASTHSPAKHKAAVDKLTQLQLLKHSSSQRASRLDLRGAVFDVAMSLHPQPAFSHDPVNAVISSRTDSGTSCRNVQPVYTLHPDFQEQLKAAQTGHAGQLVKVRFGHCLSVPYAEVPLQKQHLEFTAVSHSFVVVYRSSQDMCCWQPHLLSNWRSMPGPTGRYCL